MAVDMTMKPCRAPGCPKLVGGSGGHCEDHVKSYDRRRGTSASRGYGSRWQMARKTYLIRNPVCNECGRLATVVDHITPHKGDQKLFWDKMNWQPLCKRCHDSKTAREDGGFGK